MRCASKPAALPLNSLQKVLGRQERSLAASQRALGAAQPPQQLAQLLRAQAAHLWLLGRQPGADAAAQKGAEGDAQGLELGALRDAARREGEREGGGV